MTVEVTLRVKEVGGSPELVAPAGLFFAAIDRDFTFYDRFVHQRDPRTLENFPSWVHST